MTIFSRPSDRRTFVAMARFKSGSTWRKAYVIIINVIFTNSALCDILVKIVTLDTFFHEEEW